MTFRSENLDSAAGMRSPREPAHYVVIVEEHIERHLAGRSPCLYISPPQLRTSARALVRLLLGRPTQELGDGPWRIAIAGGEREIRLLHSSRDGQVALEF
jgi:hypothetical protein